MLADVVTERLHRRIRTDFPSAQAAQGVVGALRGLVVDLGSEGIRGTTPERLTAAVVLFARGDVHRVRNAVQLALTDWRDLLMAADLGHENWPTRLDEELGEL